MNVDINKKKINVSFFLNKKKRTCPILEVLNKTLQMFLLYIIKADVLRQAARKTAYPSSGFTFVTYR